VDQARSQTRFVTFLAVTLAAVALFLSCIGIYGVTSYLVMSRTPEMGIRMAMGASPRDVGKLVLARGMAPVVLGCLVGIALSFPLTPLLSALLFGVRPIDVPTFAASAILLSLVGFLACYIPARRAMNRAFTQVIGNALVWQPYRRAALMAISGDCSRVTGKPELIPRGTNRLERIYEIG